MSNTPYFPPIVIGSNTYDLSHLDPFKFEFQSNLAKRKIRVNVSFTSHCFSEGEGKNGGENIDTDTPRPRFFCLTRYRLSKDLPKILASLNDPRVKVKQTKSRRNWVYSIKIDDPSGPYHIFFEVKKSEGDKAKFQDVNLVVESAYHEEKSPPKVLGRMNFQLLCSKIYMRRPVATKR
ncbi:Heat shock protein C [Vibrio crassostreae]|nr:Heat shock protein C [Vibrio crassostreae]